MKPRDMEIVKDETAGEVKIPKLEYDTENKTVRAAEDTKKETNNTSVVDIIPGKKVKVIGKDGIFTIVQKLSNGKITVISNNLMLYVKPEEIINVK